MASFKLDFREKPPFDRNTVDRILQVIQLESPPEYQKQLFKLCFDTGISK